MMMLHKTDKEIEEGLSPAMADRIVFLHNLEQNTSNMPGPEDIRTQISAGKMAGVQR